MSWETDSCVSCISCISWFIPSLLPTLDCRPLQSVHALSSPLSSLLPTSRDSEAPYFGFFVYFVVTRRLPVCKRKKTENPKISWLEVNIWGGL